MTQHTPGPWRYEGGINVFADKAIIARVLADAPGRETREANARLIAAAPDLLTALQSVMEYFDPDSMPGEMQHHTVAIARDAIARATGKEVSA